MTRNARKTLRELIGDPAAAKREMQQFRASARAFTSEHPELIKAYPKQWVAVHLDAVAAASETLEGLIEKVEQQGLPKGEVAIRFIEKNHQTMIL